MSNIYDQQFRDRALHHILVCKDPISGDIILKCLEYLDRKQSDEVRQVYVNLAEFIEAAEKLLEWCPICSEGSSGDIRQQRLREAIARLRGAVA